MRKEVARGKRKGESSSAGYLVGEAKRVRDVAPFCVRVGDRSFGRVCKCIYVFKIRGMREAKGTYARAGRPTRKRRGVPRGQPGRNRMTERVRGIAVVGMIVKTGLQDATKNVRIYGTISAASSPSAPSLPPPTRLANRSPVPLFLSPRSPPPHPRLDLLLYRRSPTAVVSRNARRFLLPLLGSSLRASVPPFHPSMSSFVIPTRSLYSGRKGGPTTRRARTAGRSPPPPRALL